MFISKPRQTVSHTPESLAALVLSHDELVDGLIKAVDSSYVGPFGRKQSVADIINDAVAEIEAEDPSLVGMVSAEAIEGSWGIVDDAARAMLEERQAEQADYERGLDRPGEYESERSGAWNSV
jgi:hypothetical protein